MKRTVLLLPAFAALCFAACKNQNNNESTAKRASYFDKSGMDTTVHPGDNFFTYANGTWIKTTNIPPDQNGWGSFYTLNNENLTKLRAILDEAANKKNLKKGSVEQKVGDYYASGMDTIAIEKAGYEPVKPWLQKIDAVKNYKELLQVISEGYPTGEGDLLTFYVGADERNSSKNICVFIQSGTTLPEKEYYTRTDATTVNQRKKLEEYAAKLFILTGVDSVAATKSAADILKLETQIAASHLSPVQLRDPIRNYNKMSVSELQKMTTNIDWSSVFKAMRVNTDSINVSQPNYYRALNTLLASQPIDVWKSKVKFDYINGKAALLSKPFRDAEFEFSKVFSGQPVKEERWKTMVNMTDAGLQDLLGKLFVERYFPPEAKKRMDELVSNLQKAFKNRIDNLDWMSDSTKRRAVAKLNTFIKKIGYTDKWKNFDDVEISRDNFSANNISIAKHHYKEMIDKIGKTVDKTEWGMTPPTVNAYYNPTFNEIVFPAGILQFPFFDMNADDAINYGGIGMVIGHEMTHGFDDQGRQYDAEGNLKDWWTTTDAEKFTSKAGGVIGQYNMYTVLDSMHVNGNLTLGENLADIGGLAIAYDAFKLTEQGKSNEKIDGFTPDQRFFLGFAQVWRLKNRDETMRTRVTTDPHSLEMYRVNGPLSNFDPFYKAFNVGENNKMYKKPEDRAKIW